ncbi:HET domain-containing protein [Xylogone sp. PMI_703]|nr:HET domain-containing protein [Xylogone sp. PMI_703]
MVVSRSLLTQPYSYAPIATNAIRLFRFDISDVISGSLKEVTVNDSPPYYTLSYRWEIQKPEIPIYIDGRVLHVTDSLAKAIRQLGKLDSKDSIPRYNVKWVWIDRICINQNDTIERSRQVQLMGRIYSQAIRTLIWLGPDIESCSAAWKVIDQIYNIFTKANPSAKSIADIPLQTYSDSVHADLGLPRWNHKLWQHLRKLFELSWFTRIWIIQEVALSQEDPLILHGHRKYPWHRLGWASSWLRRKGYLRLTNLPGQIQNVDTISNIRRSGTRWNLDALLVVTSIKCHATDQRDKVYGLLGLAAESQDPAHMPDELRPNYKLDVSQVYNRVALYLFRKYTSLSILTRANRVTHTRRNQRKHNFEQLSSWIPNWCDFNVVEREVAKSLSWLLHSSSVGTATLGFPRHYNTSLQLPAKLFDSQDLSTLRLGGLKVDRIVDTTRFCNSCALDRKHIHDFLTLCIRKVTSSFSTETRATDWIKSFIEVTTADQYSLSGNTKEQALRDGSAYLLDLLLDKENRRLLASFRPETVSLLGSLSVSGNSDTYATLVGNFCFDRTFVVTSHGRIGITPAETQVGDCVTVIFGGGVPYILQRHRNAWLLVGESYIHGLMNGEAIVAWRKCMLTEEIFELR